ncbi:metal-dependent phosphohydrolase [Paenibacillus sp. CAA11]|uniref:HD-GYP domain-containing protein n=1 Tax=Paenibacillus sp. CAA11 TaxID=1532905 RepID=UPI000D3B7BEC|nr:HD domain-containing phosphohydrolase [Paenibacillus sp. CAA11]AWB43344.1 metal-dependent phosphohydrolase [Paenibacillus sp. CAA11]
MKYVVMEDVEPGQKLGKTVYSANGTVLLSAGVQLTVYMINTLNRIGVTNLYIEDELFADVEIPELLSEQTKRAVYREMNQAMQAVRSGKEWSTRKVSGSVDDLLKDVLNQKDVMLQLTEIRTEDNAEYVHAINVCLISVMIGANMGLNQGQLKDLAIGALLHDIGKSGILHGQTDEQGKGHHTWRGFETLKNKREWNLLIAHTALQHHEKLNGTGHPRGLSGQDIHLYPRIVAIANMYDNLLGGGSGGVDVALQPHEACERLMAASEQELDHQALIEFTRIISIYPNGTPVRLSNKETGVVISQHRGLPSRPVIRVVRGYEGDLEIKEVDLSSETTLFIEAVLA